MPTLARAMSLLPTTDEECNTIIEAVDGSGAVMDSNSNIVAAGTLRATWC